MKVFIIRRVRGSTPSLDVYADNLVAGLRVVRPEWTITEVEPRPWNSLDKLWMSGPGIRKFYECFWRYPKEISQQQADIFHIVDHTDAHIARWLHRTGKTVVVTCHDLVQLVYPKALHNRSRFPSLSLAIWQYSIQAMQQANHIFTVSDNTAKDVQKFLNISQQNITAVLNGVESTFRVLPSEEVQYLRQAYASDEGLCLLNVGSNHQRKNLLTVLQVLNYLKSQGNPVFLWKIGDNFDSDHKDFIEAHDLEKNIHYFGKPSKEKLIQIYNAADVLLAPSLYEGFGLTVIEAMACGTPVITSNVSSLLEVGKDAAILLDPMDFEGMAHAVIKISKESNYRRHLIEKGIARAQYLTWERASEQLALAYENILDEKYMKRIS